MRCAVLETECKKILISVHIAIYWLCRLFPTCFNRLMYSVYVLFYLLCAVLLFDGDI
jgi:hypothetical protein